MRPGRSSPTSRTRSSACAWRSRSRFCATSSVAGYTGAKSPVSASPSRSYDETAKPCRFARPLIRTAVPATSLDSSHGWLNHVALISPVSSAIRAVRIFSRPRRRLVAERTITLDDRLLVAEQVADPLRRNGLLVAARTLPEEVSDRHEPELREPPRERRTDAVQRLHGRVREARASAPNADAATRRAASSTGEPGRQARCEGSCPSQPPITIGLALSGAL